MLTGKIILLPIMSAFYSSVFILVYASEIFAVVSWRFSTTFNKWNYTFDPCILFNQPQNPERSLGDKCRYIVMCKSKISRNRMYNYAVGTKEHSNIGNVWFPYLNKYVLSVSYKGLKSHRKLWVHVALVCDADRKDPDDGLFQILTDELKKDIYAELRHRCACINGCGKAAVNFTRQVLISTNVTEKAVSASSEKDGLLTGLIVGGIALLMVIVLIVGLCHSSSSINFYQKLPTKSRKRESIKAQLDYEPQLAQSKKRELPVINCCIIPASQIETGKRLGGGIFADTFVGQWDSWTVAVKRLTLVIHPNQLSSSLIEWMKKEVNYFRKHRHRNIVSVLGLCLETRLPCLMVEFVEGVALRDYMKHNYNCMTWPLRARIVADFGITKLLQPLREECNKEDCACQKHLSACAPSVRWTAPEVLRNPRAREEDRCFSTASDVYSFGVFMWELLYNKDPFYEIDNEEKVLISILKNVRPGLKESVDYQPEYKELFQYCWNQDPQKRPKFKEVVAKCKDILNHSRNYQKSIRRRHESLRESTTSSECI
ncbi:probable serine/threonine-protein kinase drkC [Octopus bimaculoides]|uniref:probable serine/threonine-protein kinase drkC n=1 Tax=Octopus bimaculoides TaxID=37653 RepID=UPI00071D9018|nr:probable serine/threonine-protein kinase drkC [Octopus bimaculoides]|eukprot:XP_014778896.1 PREDICTED: probable serine/threonine-protein kinase drkC [Octopus bimaculoides]